MRVAFCSSEVFPFAKTGGLGDVCGSLPLALAKIGLDVSVFLPGYRCVGRAGDPVEQLGEGVSRTTLEPSINVYFVEHGGYFDREGLYGNGNGDYRDNIDRFSYYCGRVLTLLKQLDFRPHVVHCQDWQTALIPVYLREKHGKDAFYERTKSLLTIHNLAFQGVFPKEQYARLGLDEKLFCLQGFEFYDQVNLLKAGIIYSDAVTTVSPQYAREIQTQQLGCGLHDVLRGHKNGVAGILNGLDYRIWNPKTDGFIARRYSADDFEPAKLTNKRQLQKELELEARDDVPLFAFIGRLSHQKGIDLILEAVEDLAGMGAQMAFLSVGDGDYQKRLNRFASRHACRVAVRFEFNDPLAHRIYAGSDLFLMPSQFEPCGLSQMISLCYGTIPIVFKTGGLADTVKPFGPLNKNGNGFVFEKYSKEPFLKAVEGAVKVFREGRSFRRVRENAFRSRFSWDDSAHRYQEMYRCVSSD